MLDLREIQDKDGAVWEVRIAWRRVAGTIAEGANKPPSVRVLQFNPQLRQSKDSRCAEYRDDWENLSSERLLQTLTGEAIPCAEWA